MLTGIGLRKFCMELCQASYDEAGDMHKYDGIEVLVHHDSEFPRTYLAFRGSDSGSDWLVNFSAFPAKKTHSGKFHRAYTNTIHKWLDEIENLVPPGHEVVITGHSKGGAEAIIFGIHTVLPVREIVTFGAPKPVKSISGIQLEEMWRSKITNYVNVHDTVTKLPFWWNRLGKDVLLKINNFGEDHTLPKSYARFFENV